MSDKTLKMTMLLDFTRLLTEKQRRFCDVITRTFPVRDCENEGISRQGVGILSARKTLLQMEKTDFSAVSGTREIIREMETELARLIQLAGERNGQSLQKASGFEGIAYGI